MRSSLAALIGLTWLSACSQPLDVTTPPERVTPPVLDNPNVEGVFPTGFVEATELTVVPGEMLMAIARAETALQMIEGEVEFDGQEPRFGVMALPDSRIAEAAELTGYTEDEIRYERVPNVVAAAALLEDHALTLGIDVESLEAWAPVVADYSGITDEEALAEYIHYEIYDALEIGFGVEGLELKPQELRVDWPTPAREGNRTGEAGTVWSASPNHSSRGGIDPQYIVIHTCEGSYSGCWGWLRNPSAGVSAHYVVNNTGSEVRQLVDEDRKAWHIGANYSCSRNGNADCDLNGVSMNTYSVGIEHAGYGSQTSWNSGLISRSAELVCGISERHDIPLDRYHVFGHGQMQPWNRTDPGAAWPWASYMAQAEAACGAAPPAPTPEPDPTTPDPTTPAPQPVPTGTPFVIDSNNYANDTDRFYLDVSSNWWSSANVRGHYNTGYWVATTQPTSDPADFRFRVDQSEQCYRVEAWWPAAGDRPENVVFLGRNAQDNEVGRASVDMTVDGGRWNLLGNWTFNQGWNSVLLSRWTTAGSYVVADAVRLTPSTGCD